MAQTPIFGRLARQLRSWRSQIALFDEHAVTTSTVDIRSFTWPILIFFVGAVIVTAVQMWFNLSAENHSPLLPEAVYIAGIVIAIWARVLRSIWGVIGFSLLAIALCVLLDAMTYADWGNIGLYVVIVTVAYRLPLRLSLLISAFCALIILASEGLVNLLRGNGGVNSVNIVSQGLIIGFAFAASLSQRSRHLLINRLEQAQEQLRDEMGRTADLAAARERARIARDVHDVLAHSLTVLSVQTQALRQLVRDNPERAAALLDQMAEVLRESQVESRQIVGLLREAIPEAGGATHIAASLRVMAERFAERTGMRCTLHESGKPAHLSTQHVEALRFALLEALTNAYRHGKAPHAEADIVWENASVRLSVRNDGVGVAPTAANRGTGNGLRGMRERAEALGGSVEVGPQPDSGGFAISLTLPLLVGQSEAPVVDAQQEAGDKIA
jgi:signal transduction histidine kinase